MARALPLLLLLGLCAAGANALCETYVVGPGDTVGSIASKFNVQQSDLEAAIQQCDPTYQAGGYLQLNQRICLPPTYAACQYVRTSGTQDNCKYYIIQSGDTLDNIASNLGLMRLDLEALNPNAAQLQVNQFVKLTGWTDDCPAPGDNKACRVYIAGSGDTLSAIAMAFSLNLADLKEVNKDLGLGDSDTIQPGQRVKIPPFSDECGEGVVVGKPVTGNCNGYTVQAGDTLYSIAAAFQTTTDLLTQANPSAAEGVLSPGTLVYIPPYVAEDCVNGVNMVQAGQIQYTVTEAAQTGAPSAPTTAAAPAPAPAVSRRMKA